MVLRMIPFRSLTLLATIGAVSIAATHRGTTEHTISLGSPCRTASDTGAVATALVRQALTLNDSAALVSAGMPYKPVSATVVADSTVCQTLIDAYNQQVAGTDTTLRITAGYVVQAANAYVIVVPRSVPSGISGILNGPIDLHFFDASYSFKFTQTSGQ